MLDILELVYFGLNMFISSWYIFGYSTQNRLDLTTKSCTAKNIFVLSESCNSELP